MNVGVVVFPGSNCDHDAWFTVSHDLHHHAEFIWHDSDSIGNVDLVILPGGFAYGDYLRCGAIAKFSPVMDAVKKFARDGGYVLGICNGFQVLTESGLLPGALVRNASLKYVCRTVPLEVVTTNTPFTRNAIKGQTLRIPIGHGEGCYVTDEQTLDRLEAEDRVVLRYRENVNGSLRNIAGIVNEQRNVMGLMPHPERAADPLLGNTDGLTILNSLLSSPTLSLTCDP
ncbi:MAG TPA: phosphoribosylformylglycinamidine synthase subunit PurQ [Bryobacteraceae bacterium]|jgi:phosphoribosylformylglycinamidine synthase|nr:phosphoribosylformylglycinamidine synthase subunit PurQ [Bryobacteraceae bacterium]